MPLRSLRYFALMLAALAMGMHLAHALELAPKRQWQPELYLAVQMSLYRWFGIIGPVLEIGALLLVSWLALRLRGRSAFLPTLCSAIALLLALAAWALLVLPANLQLAQWQSTGVMPADWMRWRDQWQFGQAGILGLHLFGYSALLWSLLRETPER